MRRCVLLLLLVAVVSQSGCVTGAYLSCERRPDSAALIFALMVDAVLLYTVIEHGEWSNLFQGWRYCGCGGAQ